MFYVLDENNNKVEALDKEGVFAVLAQAIADGSLTSLVADAAFISKLKCCVSGDEHKVAFVSTAKYNELATAGTIEANCLYYITDDTSYADFNKALEELTATINDCTNAYNQLKSNLTDGTYVVGNAKNANNLTGLSPIEGVANSNGAWYCDIETTGIYIAVADLTYSSSADSGIYSGVIAVTDLAKHGKGSIADGSFIYSSIVKKISYSPVSGVTVNSFRVYRIGDI